MARKQTNLRLPDRTRWQLEELAKVYGASLGTTVALLVQARHWDLIGLDRVLHPEREEANATTD